MEGIARLLFTDYLFAFEVTSALLITAALGAMVLAHKERDRARVTQREWPAGASPATTRGRCPARRLRGHQLHATPALLPDGSEASDSVSPVLERRSAERPEAPVRAGREGPPATPGRRTEVEG